MVPEDQKAGKRPMDDAEQIAKRFFSVQENKVFRAVSQAQKLEAFFNCWTRKEAYIKAIGEGLSHPLDTFDVSFLPGAPAQLKTVRGDEKEAERWKLISLTPATGYVAAVMAEGQDWTLKIK